MNLVLNNCEVPEPTVNLQDINLDFLGPEIGNYDVKSSHSNQQTEKEPTPVELSNFRDQDFANILAETSFLRDDIVIKPKSDYYLSSDILVSDGVTLKGVKTATWTYPNVMPNEEFEELIDIFRNVDKLLQGKHLSKKEFFQRIKLLGLLITLQWRIKNPQMQVKVLRVMEGKVLRLMERKL